MPFLKKLLCKQGWFHDWPEAEIAEDRVNFYFGSNNTVSVMVQCTKCGKFKKITM